MNATISRVDKLVWSLKAGAVLTARQTLRMEDNADGAPVFVEGNTYSVRSVHPIATPAFVTVLDEHGEKHTLMGNHVRDWFTLERSKEMAACQS